MTILRPTPQDYDELLAVWEASVRSTHHFLTEENIQFYKPLVRNRYFQAVELYIIRNREGKIAAFMGLSDELIEMLFVLCDMGLFTASIAGVIWEKDFPQGRFYLFR